jgi:hypothetical protein
MLAREALIHPFDDREVADMDTTEIEGMSIAERIQLMEAIWASLLNSDSKMESPDWHQEVLAERHKQILDASAEFVSLDVFPMSRFSASIKQFATP